MKLWFALLALGAAACHRGPSPLEGPRPAASMVLLASLPSRAEVLARADELAVVAAKKPNREATPLLEEAARLRERIWRLEHRDADALEAVELWRTAAHSNPQLCPAELERALLDAELHADLPATYRSLYVARAKTTDADCRARLGSALTVLDAFKPLPSVLAELEREATPTQVSLKVATTPSPSGAKEGPVIVPQFVDEHTPARVTKIERYGAEDAARVSIFVTRPTTFEVGALEAANGQGPRLFVDILGTQYSGTKTYEVGGLVERVRLGAQKNGTRVVLDLAKAAYRRVFYLPEPFRLVIDVSKDPPLSIEEQKGPRALRRVVLDPGHGGHDPGATGPGGLREKDVTLDIAHRAAPLIARELGISTLLTRDSDVYVALDERTARANAFHADALISVHCNASEDGGGNGFMSFVLDESRDALATRIAARENSASAAAAAELANAMSRVIDQGSVERSVHFADLLQRSTVSSLAKRYSDVPDQGVKRAGFYVLAGARMPAVLFETSFISNSAGETRLNSADYRQKIADAIVNALRAYRDGL